MGSYASSNISDMITVGRVWRDNTLILAVGKWIRAISHCGPVRDILIRTITQKAVSATSIVGDGKEEDELKEGALCRFKLRKADLI